MGNMSVPGTTPLSFNATGTGILTLGPGTTFAGDVSATCAGICLNGATFNGAATLVKNGTSNDASYGNNT